MCNVFFQRKKIIFTSDKIIKGTNRIINALRLSFLFHTHIYCIFILNVFNIFLRNERQENKNGHTEYLMVDWLRGSYVLLSDIFRCWNSRDLASRKTTFRRS